MENIILPLHLLSLLFCVITIIQSDVYGSKWIRGKVDILNVDRLKSLHKRAWIGLVLMIITGAVLFSWNREVLLTSIPFYAKMFCVLALVVNGLLIGKLLHVATEKKFVNVDKNTKRKLYISGLVSTTAWVAAIVLAGFIVPEGPTDYSQFSPDSNTSATQVLITTKTNITTSTATSSISPVVKVISSITLPSSSTVSNTKTFSMSDIATHNTETSCYTAINGNVYDITKYIPYHPGGKTNIMKVCGVDGTSVFTRKHSSDEKPNLILRSMQIGVLK